MNNVKILFMDVSNISNSIDKNLLKFVSYEKQKRIKRFRFDIDKRLSLYAELIVQYQIYKELNVSLKEIAFIKNKYGKPFLIKHPEFQFSISHTRNAVVVAFSSSVIGVDIERIKTADFAIANRFFTSVEKNYIFMHDNPDYSFYEIWTKKEAYIKYLGTGLLTPLQSFNVLDEHIISMMNTFSVEQYIISVCCREIMSDKPIISIIKKDELYLLINELMNAEDRL